MIFSGILLSVSRKGVAIIEGMNERLRVLRKSLGMSQKNFAQKMSLTQTFLSMMEGDKSRITDKNVKLICATYNVNEEWLRDGVGEMFSSTPYEKELHEIYQKLMPASKKYLTLMARELLRTQGELLDGANQG